MPLQPLFVRDAGTLAAASRACMRAWPIVVRAYASFRSPEPDFASRDRIRFHALDSKQLQYVIEASRPAAYRKLPAAKISAICPAFEPL